MLKLILLAQLSELAFRGELDKQYKIICNMSMKVLLLIFFFLPSLVHARGTGEISFIDGFLILIVFGVFAYSIIKDSKKKKTITISLLFLTIAMLYLKVMPIILGAFLILAAPFFAHAVVSQEKKINPKSENSANSIKPLNPSSVLKAMPVEDIGKTESYESKKNNEALKKPKLHLQLILKMVSPIYM